MRYCQVFLSVAQTDRIPDALVTKQRVFSGTADGGPAKFLWSFKASDVPESLHTPKLRLLEEDSLFSFHPTEINRSLRPLFAADEGCGILADPAPVDAVVHLAIVPGGQLLSRTRSSSGDAGSRRLT